MTMIMIDQQEYELESLPEAVRDEFVSLKFVQDELHHMEMLMASLKNAERVYGEALKSALAQWREKNQANHHM